MRQFLQFCATILYKYFVKPILFRIEPDKVHDGMLDFAAASGRNRFMKWFMGFSMKFEDRILEQTLENFGNLHFKNPLGLGAGFDKNAATWVAIEKIGFSYGAFGSTTARICEGNPRPWFHRLPQYKSLMVFVGLANRGVDETANSIENANKLSKTLNVGMSIARTNDAIAADDGEGIADYRYSLEKLNGKTAYIEINISCPNTFKGEPFTDPKRLDLLLTELDKVNPKQPITLKMPSDKSFDEFRELVKVASKHNVQALTIANLRKDRNGLEIDPSWKGNLSGKPTQKLSNDLIKETYREFGDRFVIIGLGGVFSAEDAYEKIKNGASLVSFVSALMFEGPASVARINRGLAKLLRKDGFTNISQAVGKNVKNS